MADRVRIISFLAIFLVAAVFLGHKWFEMNSKENKLRSFEHFSSNSTTEMASYAQDHLEPASCVGEDYYRKDVKNSNYACFKCKNGDVCIEYKSVKREGSETKMNKGSGFQLSENISDKEKMSIRTAGLSENISCRCEGKFCRCKEGIKINYTEKYGVILHGDLPQVIGPGREEIEEIVRVVAEPSGGQCEFNGALFECKGLSGSIIEISGKKAASVGEFK